jgi:HTH-type transcriptional regulator/antitoxin HigA
VLRFLIEQNDLTQRDLAAELGSDTTVSLVLAGKRLLTRHQIQKLSQRFHASPAVFL